jgi:hypothetical protein
VAFTLEEKIACLEREVRMRKRVYPRWVEAGRMQPAQAEHEMQCMQAIIDDLRAQLPPPPQGSLL